MWKVVTAPPAPGFITVYHLNTSEEVKEGYCEFLALTNQTVEALRKECGFLESFLPAKET